VRVWEEPLVLPTYEVGKPDPNPRFYETRVYQGAKGPVYPYPMLDVLTNNRVEKTYTALYLENKYLHICVLPEIGGRIFTALDKTNNYDFFYRQHVVKPALIGMLGAWISGGVEWCVFHHHRATTFMPTDYTIEENADGSKTIWVGELERRHRMHWLLGVTLYPDKSYLEVTVKMFNRTPLANSILHWANVAVHSGPDYQVYFPPDTEWATFHGKNQFSRWPISREQFNNIDYTAGVDVSLLKSHPKATSFFAWESKGDFFGGYDHAKQAGVVHVANPHAVPGKKLWTWGTESTFDRNILTDSDGPYAELMVGAYSDNQPDYSWLGPYEVRTFKQYWYPLRQLGGVNQATREAAVNLELLAENKVRIGFNTTTAYVGAMARLVAGDEVLFERRIDIAPDKPFVEEVPLPRKMDEKKLRVTLLSPNGKELVEYRCPEPAGSPMPDPVEPPPAPEEIQTIEELYLTGLRLEQFYNPTVDPLPYYEEALRRDPNDSRVNTRLGIEACRRGLFDEAEEHLRRAIKRLTNNYTNPKECEPYYYLGVALAAQGELDEAYEAFYRATWRYPWRGAGYFSLAVLDARKGDLRTALAHVDRSLEVNSLNTKALNLRATVLRALGDHEAAEKQASAVLDMDPLDFWAGNELYVVARAERSKPKADRALAALKELMRDDVESFLELACDYMNAGFLDAATKVLSRLDLQQVEAGSTYPMVYYYLGYLGEKKGDHKQAAKYYRFAGEMPPDYCFPHRLESIGVLERAIRANPGDARAHYYLGNLLYDHQPERAIREWEISRDLDGSFYIVHRNLGFGYAQTEDDVTKAIANMETAMACNSQDARVQYELDRLYEKGGVEPEKRLAAQDYETILQRDDALTRQLALYVQVGDYDRAIDVLATHHFNTWEGGDEVHDVYANAHLLRGLARYEEGRNRAALEDFQAALEYPENLEVERPANDVKAARAHYLVAVVHERLGDEEQARGHLKKAVSLEVGESPFAYYQGLASRKLGFEDRAQALFDGLIEAGKDRLQKDTSLDFFAKFGGAETRESWLAEAHFLVGLGHLGKDDKEGARAEFENALALNPGHLWAKVHRAKLE
jgi:tetratricopeptide (TPR) repeat protein